MKCLIIGLGIGQLYKKIFEELGFSVDTVDTDPSKNATYKSIEETKECYNLAVICTPNYTHENIARSIASQCRIVLIEKPGVETSEKWTNLVNDFPQTRFMMIKNNQYRKEAQSFKHTATSSTSIEIVWNNKNRVPNPGSWFTTKSLSFGGVSRDLLPHMLSYYTYIEDYLTGSRISAVTKQNHSLSSIVDTDYGTVNRSGTYDVDDFAELKFNINEKIWTLTTTWKNDQADEVYIQFNNEKNTVHFILGLCPEEAYKNMILTVLKNVDNQDFWNDQYQQDLWIHQQIENL